MKTMTAAILVMSVLFASTGFSEKDKDKKQPEMKAQTVCPVMGGKINKSVFADHDGKRVYFCCKGCDAAFKKDPAKYLKKMAENGEQPAQLQTHCPVMGGKINKSAFADHDGKRVYFCCKGCGAAFKADPEKYIKLMQDKGIVLETAPKKKK